MKIVFLDTKTIGNVKNISILEQFGEVTYFQTTYPDQTLERIKGAEIVITNKVVLDEQVIQRSECLKLICVAATGTNNIAKEAAKKHDIKVKNVSDYSTKSVAQVTISLLLHLINKIYYFDKYVKNGNYSESDTFTNVEEPFWEIAGKRFGIIGLGNIGSQVANIATAFGAEVVYYSASGRNNQQPYLQVDMDTLLETSDILSIHAPLNQYTENLLTYNRLSQMKKSAILINTGRGGIVNEKDLARALDENIIAGAGIDVFENEPIDKDNPLLNINNKEKIALTPHIAWASEESRSLLIEKIAENIQKFLSN